MSAPVRQLLSTLPKGHEFSPTAFSIARDDLSRYLDAVGDANAIYFERGLAPPLCAAALALGSLLEVLELPAGTLHTGQEIEMQGGVPIDVPLTLSGRIAQRSERAGLVITILEFEVASEGEALLRGRSTVMVAAS